MHDSTITLKESIQLVLPRDNRMLCGFIDSLYKPNGDILSTHYADFIKASGLKIDENTLNRYHTGNTWYFTLPISLNKGKRYYWRVRIKNQRTVVSDWSKTGSFVL